MSQEPPHPYSGIQIPRRRFLRNAALGGTVAALGARFGFLDRLPAVSAGEVQVDGDAVRLHPDIEPLVRLIEETPRERLLEEVADRIVHRGLSYREVLAALMLAGVRNIQPRPVGFKFHAVLVVNSAHLAAMASPDSDRWLPIFWALDYFKSSQARDIREGNWTMAPVDESAVPSAHRARAAFVQAMDRWDEAGADAAVAALARHHNAGDLFDLFARYGSRDFRDIGHKAIYVANSFRTLEVIGWHHAEPVLRSLAYALLCRSGDSRNPADEDLRADRPFRLNLERVDSGPRHWLAGREDHDSSLALVHAVREGGNPADLSQLVVDRLNKGISARSLMAGCFLGAGELVMQTPNILSLHAMTFTNAIHYAWNRCRDRDTRRMLLLQNASFLPMFKRRTDEPSRRIDEIDPLVPEAADPAAAAEEIFADLGDDPTLASRKVLGQLQRDPNPVAIGGAARRLIFLKGTNSHDYKYSSAILEDYEHLPSPAREQMLAASVYLLRDSGLRDNTLVERIRAALV